MECCAEILGGGVECCAEILGGWCSAEILGGGGGALPKYWGGGALLKYWGGCSAEILGGGALLKYWGECSAKILKGGYILPTSLYYHLYQGRRPYGNINGRSTVIQCSFNTYLEIATLGLNVTIICC